MNDNTYTDKICRLKRAIEAQGPGTYTLDALPADRQGGYWVGGYHPNGELVDPTVKDLVRWLRTRWLGGTTFVGYWIDPETGRKVWDISTHTTDREYALDQARARGEKAVWDVEAGTEIWLPGKGPGEESMKRQLGEVADCLSVTISELDRANDYGCAPPADLSEGLREALETVDGMRASLEALLRRAHETALDETTAFIEALLSSTPEEACDLLANSGEYVVARARGHV